MPRLAPSVVVALSLGALPGCSTVPRGLVAPPEKAGATNARSTKSEGDEYSYSGGRASQTFGDPPNRVHGAVLEAMGDLQIKDVRRMKEGGVVLFEGTTPDNRRASVTLRPHSQMTTRLTARVGLFGDNPYSKTLFDRVAIRLGELPPAAIPTEVPSAPSSNPFINLKSSVGPNSEMLKEMADARYRDLPLP